MPPCSWLSLGWGVGGPLSATRSDAHHWGPFCTTRHRPWCVRVAPLGVPIAPLRPLVGGGIVLLAGTLVETVGHRPLQTLLYVFAGRWQIGVPF